MLGTFSLRLWRAKSLSFSPETAGAGERWPVPPLTAVMCARKPVADLRAPALPRVQNPAAAKMLSLVGSLEEELFAAEARRHDAEVH